MVQPDLNLLQYADQLNIKIKEDKRYIFDPIRKKYLVLLPEEFVRQLLIHHLIHSAAYSQNRISVEKKVIVHQTERRFDILVYSQQLDPFLLIECKAPSVPISQATMDQVAQYNISLKVPYLLVTNGKDTYVCQVNFETKAVRFLSELPRFE